MADAATVSVLIQAKDNASREFKNVESNMGKMVKGIQQHRRAIGMAMTAMGAAIVGIGLLSVKSSLDQQVGINRLDQSLKNVGTSYANQKIQIEKVVAAQQLKTNYGDEAQREALQKLVTIGGQWEGSLAALKITTDVAAGANIDLNAAALLVGKAIAGETSSLSRYGIILEKGATQTEIMAALTSQFGGAAEAAADPITQMKNRMGDLFQVLGDALLPVLEALLPKIEKATRRVIEWAEAHPTLTKVLALVGTAIGAILLVLGPMLLILPQLFAGMKLFAAGIRLVTIAMKANPIGLLLTVLTTLALVALPLVMKHWDSIWGKILKITETVANFIIGILNKLTIIWRQQFELIATIVGKLLDMGSKLPFVGDKFKDAADAIRGFSDRLEDGIPQIDLTSGRQKDLQDAVNSTANTFEMAGPIIQEEQRRVGEAAEEAAVVVVKSNEKVGSATESAARMVAKSAEMMSLAWGEVEDAVMEAELIVRESAQRQADTQAYFAQLNLDTERSLRDQSREDYLKWIEDGLAASKARQDAEARALEQQIGSWDKFKQNLDPVMASINESNLSYNDIIQRMADATGRSLEEMGLAVEEHGLHWRDTWGLIKSDLFMNIEDINLGLKGLEGEVDRVQNKFQNEFSIAGVASRRPAGEEPGNAPISVKIAAQNATMNRARSIDELAGQQYILAHTPWGHPKMTGDWQTRKSDLEERIQFLSSQVQMYTKEIQDLGFSGAFARGGTVKRGGIALVGERGPELVSLPGGSMVHANGTGPGGGVTNQFHFHGAVYGVEDLKEAVVEAVRDHAISGGFSGVFAEA